jgi:hypothetical protein
MSSFLLTLLPLSDIILILLNLNKKFMEQLPSKAQCDPQLCGLLTPSIGNIVGLLCIVGGIAGFAYGIIELINYMKEKNPAYKGTHLTHAITFLILGSLVFFGTITGIFNSIQPIITRFFLGQ